MNALTTVPCDTFDGESCHHSSCIRLAEHARYEAALREIVTGKVAADNTHPLGEYAAMAMRFLTIAQTALVSTSVPPSEKP